MTKLLNKAADKILDRLIPKSTASADTTWNEWCASCRWSGHGDRLTRPYRVCYVVGGRSGCGTCNNWADC
ncbi:hypothetical protein Afil01_33980 [Actinorhabdospora filicis]|uniref:Uncharacterized protein n=1 Tax=Actinorhabdospora filicis TaxID=1785913 RepID=A0A9W6WAG9_9ACTN|nr:hypothetical protein [Actinorhabdospora filicis]GLZ78591.1 hypothetical protein Afil01_33980 [Actinorhabdospora filicis]